MGGYDDVENDAFDAYGDATARTAGRQILHSDTVPGIALQIFFFLLFIFLENERPAYCKPAGHHNVPFPSASDCLCYLICLLESLQKKIHVSVTSIQSAVI